MSKKRLIKGYNERYLPLGLVKIEEILKKHKVPEDLTAQGLYKRAEDIAKEANKNVNNTKIFRTGQILEHISWNEYGFYKWTALKSLLICREKLREIESKNKTFEFSEHLKYGA